MAARAVSSAAAATEAAARGVTRAAAATEVAARAVGSAAEAAEAATDRSLDPNLGHSQRRRRPSCPPTRNG